MSSPYYASFLHQLRSSILEKRRGKLRFGVLLLLDNAPAHKSNVTLAAIQYRGFTEFSHPAYSPNIVTSDYNLFSKVKNFLYGRNFETDDEAIMTVSASLFEVLILILFF